MSRIYFFGERHILEYLVQKVNFIRGFTWFYNPVEYTEIQIQNMHCLF